MIFELKKVYFYDCSAESPKGHKVCVMIEIPTDKGRNLSQKGFCGSLKV